MLHGILIVLAFGISYAGSQLQRPTVKIPQGYLIGTKVYGDYGKIADTYFGIPYAAPPLGNLRFAPPQRHEGWNGTYQAFDYGPPCPQLPIRDGQMNNEDCLYLNIWAPENAVRYGPIPVVILFEGQEFAKSNKIPIIGQDLAMERVVVVTINYRINVFGFLCLGNQDMRGNFGLIDQYLAMLWVKENIKYFGGDPDKITLFGYSAGAASVAYHMISPRTKGFFQRAILSSGSSLSPWHLSNNKYTGSEKVVRLLGCSDAYAKTMLQCLRSKTTMDILKAYEEYTESGSFPDLFLPVVDEFLPESDRYLPVHPSVAFKEGTFLQIPILTGIATAISDSQTKQWMDLTNQGFMQLQQYFEQSKIPEVIQRYQYNNQNKGEITELLKWRYISSSEGDVRLLLEQLKAFNFEAKIEAPHFTQLNYLASTFVQPIYVYYMDNIGFALNDTETILTPDMLLLFGPLLLNQVGRRRFTTQEMEYSKRLKQMWTNFIIYGNPTPNNNRWRRYVANEYYIENFGSIANNYNDQVKRSRKISFWTQLLPKIANMKYHNSNNPNELHLSPDPAAGFRHAMYTLVGLVIALLALLLVCIILLKKRTRENERPLHMGY